MPPDTKALVQQRICQRLGIGDDLLLISLELGLERLVEADCLGRDHVLERAALRAREDGLVELLAQLLVVREDDAAARAAQRLMRGGGDNVRIRQRVHVQAGRNQARNVHADTQKRPR